MNAIWFFQIHPLRGLRCAVVSTLVFRWLDLRRPIFAHGGATVEMDLFGPSPTAGNNSFNVQSAFLRGASLNLNFNFPPRDGDVIRLINKTSAGAISGTLTNWPCHAQ